MPGINFGSANRTGRLEVAITGLKIAILAVLVAFALRVVLGPGSGPEAYTPYLPRGLGGLAAGHRLDRLGRGARLVGDRWVRK